MECRSHVIKVDHSPGPLDGSLYARVNKQKHGNNAKTQENVAELIKTKPPDLTVVVVGGNKVTLTPKLQYKQDLRNIDMENNLSETFKVVEGQIEISGNGYVEVPLPEDEKCDEIVTEENNNVTILHEKIIINEKIKVESQIISSNEDVAISSLNEDEEVIANKDVVEEIDDEVITNIDSSTDVAVNPIDEDVIVNKYTEEVLGQNIRNSNHSEESSSDSSSSSSDSSSEDECIKNEYADSLKQTEDNATSTVISNENFSESISQVKERTIHEDIAKLAQEVDDIECQKTSTKEDIIDGIKNEDVLENGNVVEHKISLDSHEKNISQDEEEVIALTSQVPKLKCIKNEKTVTHNVKPLDLNVEPNKDYQNVKTTKDNEESDKDSRDAAISLIAQNTVHDIIMQLARDVADVEQINNSGVLSSSNDQKNLQVSRDCNVNRTAEYSFEDNVITNQVLSENGITLIQINEDDTINKQQSQKEKIQHETADLQKSVVETIDDIVGTILREVLTTVSSSNGDTGSDNNIDDEGVTEIETTESNLITDRQPNKDTDRILQEVVTTCDTDIKVEEKDKNKFEERQQLSEPVTKQDENVHGIATTSHEKEADSWPLHSKPLLSPPVYTKVISSTLIEIPITSSRHVRSSSITKVNGQTNLQEVDVETKKIIKDTKVKPINHNNLNHPYFDKGPEYAVPHRDFSVKKSQSKQAVLITMNTSNQEPPHSPYINNEVKKVPEDVQALIKGLTSSSDADSGFDGSAVTVHSGTPISPGMEEGFFNDSREDLVTSQHPGEKRYVFHNNAAAQKPNTVPPTRIVSDLHEGHIEKNYVKQAPSKKSVEKATANHPGLNQPMDDRPMMDDAVLDVEDQLEQENIKNVEDQIMHTKKHLEWLESQQVKLRQRHNERKIEVQRKRNSSALESQSFDLMTKSHETSTLPRTVNNNINPARPSSAAFLSEDLLQAVKQLEHIDMIDNEMTLVRNTNHENHINQNGAWRSQNVQPPLPKKSNKTKPTVTSDVNANDLSATSSDLQMQLAELDACIAQLTSSIEIPPQSPRKKGAVVLRHRRSFSTEIDRQLDPNIPVTATSPVGLPAPQPPSRTRSSFNSVSRLSQEFDSKKMNFSPDSGSSQSDDVFSPTNQNSRSKFPPQTSLTRRHQIAPEPPAKTMGPLENRLSPDVVFAVRNNPGARPKENIHSYKEDLDPDPTPSQQDSPLTPGFPPPTPYVNNLSPSSPDQSPHGRHPVGMAETPLSALHLKPRETALTSGTKEVASQPVTKETTLVSDDLKNIRLEEKIQREKQQLQQRQNLTPNQQYVKENPIVANHSPNSLTSTPYSVSTRSRDGSTDSLDGANTSVTSDNQPRHSNSSLLSSSSSSSSHPHSNELHNNAMGSRLRANGGPNVHHHDDNISHGSGRTSTSSLSDAEKLTTTTSVAQPPRFVHETLNLWYKPDISREQALEMLRDKPAGYFVVRDSRCFPGAFGLALKVEKLPINVRPQPGVDIQNELVRHFLIEPSSRGVKLKGCPNEPVFGSLSALVYQHSITPLALPCRLVIPKLEPGSSPMGTLPRAGHDVANSATDLLRQGAACNVIYINSVITESLTGPPAIERAIQDILKNTQRMAVVHFKVSPQGVTLTDNARKIFFRRHYPTSTVTYCGLDPRGNDPRRYDTSAFGGRTDAWMFGFVAKKQSSSSDNVCHVFAELEAEQPARAIVNFVSKVLIGTSRS